MVEGKGRASGWFRPLLDHALLHATLTLFVVLFWTRRATPALLAFAFDLIAHFSIDRVKSSPNMLGRFRNSDSKAFWILLGADQLAHNFCYLAIVFGYLFLK